jgi:intracellular septation protein A
MCCPSASMCGHLTWIIYLACERDVHVEISLATLTGLGFMFTALQTMYLLLVYHRCMTTAASLRVLLA